MIAEAAARLGHSPEVLLSIYTKRVSDGVQRSNYLLDVAYAKVSGVNGEQRSSGT
jgi:hypothetical protein